jgi:oxygen-independent coproporphyrinogen-3 oxidase
MIDLFPPRAAPSMTHPGRGGILSGMDPIDGRNSRDAAACGLYMHVPYCETKCGYCDFYSVPTSGRISEPTVRSLVRELNTRLAGDGHLVRTVFCGGGTPTILPCDELERLLRAVVRVAPVEQLEEFTVEANPATLDDVKAGLLCDTGVSRVSMGAQSFFAGELATLERLHTPDDIAPSVATVRRHGIAELNLDLMFGIPGQTQATWRESLARAIVLEPDHVACYGLTYEPGTRLTALRDHGRMTPCDEGLEADMYRLMVEVLEAAGYRQYETSNFARPGRESRHNLMYWRNRPYIGIGPSAAGCIDGRRYKNVSDIAAYNRLIDEQGHAEAESETITPEMLMLEMILMQLRLVEGLSIEDFTIRTGIDPRVQFAAVIERLSNLDMVTLSDTHIALTNRGRLVSDAIMMEFALCCDGADVPLKIMGG